MLNLSILQRNFRKNTVTAVGHMIRNACVDPNFENEQSEYIRVILESSNVVTTGAKEASHELVEILNSRNNTPLERHRAIELIRGLVENAEPSFRSNFASYKLWSTLGEIVNTRTRETTANRKAVFLMLNTWKLHSEVDRSLLFPIPPLNPPEDWFRTKNKIRAQDPASDNPNDLLNPFEALEMDPASSQSSPRDSITEKERKAKAKEEKRERKEEKKDKKKKEIRDVVQVKAKATARDTQTEKERHDRPWYLKRAVKPERPQPGPPLPSEDEIKALAETAEQTANTLLRKLQRLEKDQRPRDFPKLVQMYDASKRYRREIVKIVYQARTTQMDQLLKINDDLNSAISAFNLYQADVRDSASEEEDNDENEGDELAQKAVAFQREREALKKRLEREKASKGESSTGQRRRADTTIGTGYAQSSSSLNAEPHRRSASMSTLFEAETDPGKSREAVLARRSQKRKEEERAGKKKRADPVDPFGDEHAVGEGEFQF